MVYGGNLSGGERDVVDRYYGVNGQRERSGDDFSEGVKGVLSKSHLVCFGADSAPVAAAELLGTPCDGRWHD